MRSNDLSIRRFKHARAEGRFERILAEKAAFMMEGQMATFRSELVKRETFHSFDPALPRHTERRRGPCWVAFRVRHVSVPASDVLHIR